MTYAKAESIVYREVYNGVSGKTWIQGTATIGDHEYAESTFRVTSFTRLCPKVRVFPAPDHHKKSQVLDKRAFLVRLPFSIVVLPATA